MPSRSRLLSHLVRYGVRYAPLAYEGIKRTRGPVQEAAQAGLSRRSARTMAMEHAAHLVDGSVLPVYDGDTQVWVVFSGSQVVGTHPVVRTPVADLLTFYDLDKRIRPSAQAPRRLPSMPKRGEGRGRRGPAADQD